MVPRADQEECDRDGDDTRHDHQVSVQPGHRRLELEAEAVAHGDDGHHPDEGGRHGGRRTSGGDRQGVEGGWATGRSSRAIFLFLEAWRSGSLGAASPQASLLGFGGFCALSRSAGPSSPRAPQPPPSPKCASLVMEAWGTRVAVSWVQALAARLVPSLVSSLLVPGLVPGLVSSVIATLAPLRHASNLGGPFNLCSLLSAVSLGPPEGATTHDYSFA